MSSNENKAVKEAEKQRSDEDKDSAAASFITIPGDIKVKPEDDKTWNALKAIGNPDVNEDKDAPPLGKH